MMRPIEIQRRAFLMCFIIHMMWLHLRHLIAIQWPQLNGDDSHQRVSSELLMRFMERMRPNRLSFEMFFVSVKHSRAIQSNWTV